MKAAPLTHRPSFQLMKQTDIQRFYHLQMPRWLFDDPVYKGLSLEAKVGYTFLLNRFQLSRLKGWVNKEGEVFIIFTRQSLADEMQISYRKAIEAMKELTAAGLIWEKRCGRGDANQIYLAKVEQTVIAGGSVPFVDPEDERSAEVAGLEGPEALEQEGPAFPRSADSAGLELEVPKEHIQKCRTDTSMGAESAGQEVPNLHPSYIDINHTDWSDIDVSLLSEDEQLERILEQCELYAFSEERAKVYQAAVERLFYLEQFRTGGATLPQARVRAHLRRLDYTALDHADRKISSNTEREVKNTMAYIMAVIFNAITEVEGDLMLDPYLNQLGGD